MYKPPKSKPLAIKTQKAAIKISAARSAAFAILLDVAKGQAHSDVLLRSEKVERLSAQDRNLATTLVMGVLRWQITLDASFRKLLAKPNAKLDVEVETALRMAVFQMQYLDRIPDRAAIVESVELVKKAGHKFAAGMVNAVLRKVATVKRPEYSKNSVAELALATSHPQWMVERWAKSFGLEQAKAICEHGQVAAPTVIRLTQSEIEQELLEEGITLSSSPILTAARMVNSGDVTGTAAFADSRLRIQDEGSQLVAEIAVAFKPEAKMVLDTCAAPGGKLAILNDRLPTAKLIACEAHPARFATLKSRLQNYSDRIEFVYSDAEKLDLSSRFDLILADAPCSGTGTLGRNPEIRYRLTEAELLRQQQRQISILNAVSEMLNPEGILVYSTCSLEPEEDEQVIAEFLKSHSNLKQVSVNIAIEQMLQSGALNSEAADTLKSFITESGSLRLFPNAFGTDGFFVAAFRRSKLK